MWVLVFMISSGFGYATIGGPAVIENFDTRETCEAFSVKLKQDLRSKYDWGRCYKKDK